MPSELPPELPPEGVLTSFARLLRGTHLAPPDRLPHVVASAAEAFGGHAVLYLVDYRLERLVPFVDPEGPDSGRESLGLDGTVPGHAFRLLQTQVATAENLWRLWVPVVDGVERLGVLDVMFDHPMDLDDPGLRQHCALFAHFVGHLVTIADDFGDAVDAVRRSAPRNAAAELVWRLTPPQTCGTDKVVISGRLEPCDRVGGDVFDYALSESRAQLAIIDATGHDLAAGMVSAAALSAYRNTRREGGSLVDQARAVNEAVSRVQSDGAYATGIFAELDLDTGRLRYLAAGHPYPLLMRGGQVVKALTGGRQLLFGIEAEDVEVAEEMLERGDTLVLYSDGVTEATDEHGEPFGTDGLSRFLERESATGAPPPEVLRRLTRSILRRQHGELRDDATVLLTHWTQDAQAMLDHNAMVRG